MDKEILKRIFEFLEDKGEHNAPVKWKLINNIPLIEEELNIKGDLEFARTNIESLPKGLKIRGLLDLGSSKIKSLPEGLKVKTDLFINHCKFIRDLPKGLKVGGDLVLTFTKITSLPEDLKVGGYLYIRNTPLTKYTDQELREMLKLGFIKGEIFR